MRILSFLLVCSVLIASTPAQAGKVSYIDGRGRWIPSSCEAPRPPASLAADSETAAEDLNARMAAHNAFVSASGAYMDCVSQEAQRDADSMSHMIVNEAQALMAQTQANVEKSAQLVNSK